MDRVAAAQARVRRVKAEIASPAATLPCVQCRYYELVCAHPAVIAVTPKPISGGITVKHGDPDFERSEKGACGPEGALFDARSIPGQIIVATLQTAVGRWGLFFAVAIGLDMLLR